MSEIYYSDTLWYFSETLLPSRKFLITIYWLESSYLGYIFIVYLGYIFIVYLGYIFIVYLGYFFNTVFRIFFLIVYQYFRVYRTPVLRNCKALTLLLHNPNF